MRLWHKDLISLLPDEQLLEQWQDILTIADNLAKYGTPNDPLVNRITDFILDEFYTYAIDLVLTEMNKRYYKVDQFTIERFNQNLFEYCGHDNFTIIDHQVLFQGWMSTRYLQQCILHLEELYDVGEIELKDWFKIVNGVRNMSVLCDETFETLFT